jgi:hypothetical protein
MHTVTLHLHSEPPPLSNYRRDVPRAVANIIGRLLAKRPAARYQTPAELAAALRRVLAHLRASPARTPDQPAPALPDGDEEKRDMPRTAAVHVKPTALATAEQLHELECEGLPGEDRAPALWREWLTIVETIAAGLPGHWDQTAYKKVHGPLLQALRHPSPAAPAEQAQLYTRLENIVEPWLTLRSFQDLDRNTLLQFCETCRQMSADMPPPPRPARGTAKLVISLLTGAALVVSTFLLVQKNLPVREQSKPPIHRLTPVK